MILFKKDKLNLIKLKKTGEFKYLNVSYLSSIGNRN